MILTTFVLLCAQQQVQTLTASDAGSADNFGAAMDLTADVAIVGAPFKPFQGLNFAGAAYIYRSNAGVWMEEAKLLAPVPDLHDDFGTSVAIDGDVAVVGAPDFPFSFFTGTGRAWVYRRSVGGNWLLEQELVPSIASTDSGAGRTVVLSGNTIAVTSNVTIAGGNISFFEYNGTTWVETDVIQSQGLGRSWFASKLSLQGDRLIVNSEKEVVNGIAGAGAAYVYERQAGVWSETARLTAPGVTDAEAFGTEFALDGDLLAIGAPNAEFNGLPGAGRIYVFRFLAGSWSLEASLDNAQPQSAAFLGGQLSMEGGLIVSASEANNSGAPFRSGAGHLFEEVSTGQWEGGIPIYPEDGTANLGFGIGVSVSSGRALFATRDEQVRLFDLTAGFRLRVSSQSGQLTAGAVNLLEVTGATPLQTTWLAMSLVGFGSRSLPSLGVDLLLSSPEAFGNSQVADVNGSTTWQVNVPSAGAGRTAWWQAVQVGQASNAFASMVQ